MKLYRVRGEIQADLVRKPETAMGLQILVEPQAERWDRAIVITGGQVAFDLGQLIGGDAAIESPSEPPWLRHLGDDEGRPWVEAFGRWMERLDPLELPVADWPVVPISAFRLYAGAGPLPPQPPAAIYGHLPFAATTGHGEVCYRWEAFPSSRRIDQRNRTITAGTFAAPMSEVAFLPTGFAAVARLALPSVLPACFRWELRPPANTRCRCGASVPLYGQSGGGVEIAFTNGFTNVGAIANPVVLPAL